MPIRNRFVDPEGFCVACGREGVSLHHVKTRGAGGTNDDFNLMPLCQAHHNQVHAVGLSRVAEIYYGIIEWLESNNWKYDKYVARWLHDKEF